MPTDLDQLAADFDRVFHSLSRVELQRGASSLESLELEDLFSAGEGMFLGFYTAEGLEHAFEQYGLFASLRELGFADVRVGVVTDDPDEHLMRIWSDEPKLEAPLLELVARRDVLRPTHELAQQFGEPFLPVLTIEWLQMQNPVGEFSPDRLPLPGQRFPGLGLGAEVLTMLQNACRRLDLEALVTVPAYFHNAVFYSEAFAYFDPAVQGQFLALTRDIVPQANASVAAASWALNWNMVTERADDEPVVWFHDAMVAPISDRLVKFFDSDLFQREVNETLAAKTYRVVPTVLDQQLEARGLVPFDPKRIEDWVDEQ